MKIQLTLEQYGFEPCGSIYMHFFSKSKYYMVCGQLKSVGVELWAWRVHCKIILKFWTTWRMAPLSHIVGGKTVYSTPLVIRRMYIKSFQDIG